MHRKYKVRKKKGMLMLKERSDEELVCSTSYQCITK